ncbi:D-alanine--D-alanine ligase [Aristophania vespae]|uniref:D-alanine--D-alanine ligase n=1 Tax=Aristophania vespae TaxID=2697033 RepID=UPI00235152D0|nr:D-alanine--D-alanine ligase [Aristophania vespae]
MTGASHNKKTSHPLKVAVLMGGISSEREISLTSGKAVKTALSHIGHDAHAIDVNSDIIETITSLKTLKPDVVFNALHGPGGEDGTIQALLEWLKLPYTHSGVLASATAMDKAASRLAFAAHNLPIARGMVLTPQELAMSDPLDRPYVIKPVSEGSSVGVTILQPGEFRRTEIANSWDHGKQILVEEYIPGRELTVGVLRDTALAVTEILPLSGDFYDFGAKYQTGGSRHIIPANLPPQITEKAFYYACQAHNALGCRGASRTDFRYDEQTDRLVILEVNNQPGMTPTSLLPEQSAWRGLSYELLCDWMVKEALALNTQPILSLLEK